MKSMKLIMENFRSFSEQDDIPYEKHVELKLELLEQKLKKNLNEVEVSYGDFKLKAEWTKWSAMAGIAGSVCATAAYIATMYAPFEVVAMATLGGLFSNPLIMGLTALIGLRFKFVRKILGKIFKLYFNPIKTDKIAKSAEAIIKKMISESKGKISDEQAKEILAKFSETIVNHPKMVKLIEEIEKFLDGGDLKQAGLLARSADSLVREIAMEEIFETTPEQTNILDTNPEFEAEEEDEEYDEDGKPRDYRFGEQKMKSMKLIMENFRKTMNEAWPGTPEQQAPWGKDPKPYVDTREPGEEVDPKKQELIQRASDVVAKEIVNSFGGEFGSVWDIMNHPTAKIDMRDIRERCQRALGDEMATAGADAFFDITEKDMLAMIDAINLYEDPEHEEPLPSDQEEDPGNPIGRM